jgi:hypothetical protein
VRHGALTSAGNPTPAQLVQGFRLAFLVAALLAFLGALITLRLVRQQLGQDQRRDRPELPSGDGWPLHGSTAKTSKPTWRSTLSTER